MTAVMALRSADIMCVCQYCCTLTVGCADISRGRR